ncbi:TetR/AcrR family transcriptional regulator [Streptomyces sp. NPDC101455]|uniref:TetR/AcrR family transcriptional regulator n=1 Tax=Streptomyces sp. NPDC101455 TaxID=3366142 RepID=UPI00381CE89A
MSATATPNSRPDTGTRRSIRESVLNVAFDMHSDGTWERTSMRNIAIAAGVSRQTLYDQFGDRTGVTRALLGRETDRLLDGVDQRWRQVRENGAAAGDCLAAAMNQLLAASHSHPLLREVLTGRDPGLAGTNGGLGLAGVITELCRRLGYAVGTYGQPARPDQLRAVEILVRVTLSYLLVPAEPHQQARIQIEHAARTLLPAHPRGPRPAAEPVPADHPSDREREPLFR